MRLMSVLTITIVSVIEPVISGKESNKKGYKCVNYKIYVELSAYELEKSKITAGTHKINLSII